MLAVVNINKGLVEPFSDLVDAAFIQLRADLARNWDAFSEQKLVDIENDQPSESDFI